MASSSIKESPLEKKLEEGLAKGFHLQILYRNHLNKSALEPKATLNPYTIQPDSTKFGSITLKEIRDEAGDAIEKKWSFCLENDAVIQEGHTLGYYISLSATNVSELLNLPKEPPKKDAEKIDAHNLPTTYMNPTLTILMVSAKSVAPPSSEGRNAQQAWLKENKPDLKFSTVPDFKAPAVPADYKTDYLATDTWKIDAMPDVAGKGLLDCVIDMKMDDWRTVLLLNKLVYGSDIRGIRKEQSGTKTPSGPASLEVANARLPAFSLQSGIPSEELQLPEFVEVMDSPQITITEVKNDLQSSLAKSAFSARSLEVLTGGGTPMISAAVSAGIAVESQKASGNLEGQKRTEYFATYNFPRVKVFLDEYTLKVSPQCKAALNKLRDTKTIEELLAFQRRFGTLFTTEIVLGGRLETTKYAKSGFTSENALEKDALKASVGANFTSPQFALSSKVSTEGQDKRETSRLDLSSEAMLSWTAKGGNTILCANPPVWAASVAVFRNWRVIQQDEVVPLQTLLGRFEDFGDIPKLFQEILAKYNKEKPSPSVTMPTLNRDKEWTEKTMIRLFTADAALRQSNGDEIQPAELGDFFPADSLFSVRNGDPEENGGRFFRGLRADYPLALLMSDAPDNLGAQYDSTHIDTETGVWKKQIAGSGKKRFSLRPVSTTGAWKPKPESFLKEGDKVKLYYHGFDATPFKLDSPPAKSDYVAMYHAADRKVMFTTPKKTLSAVGRFEEAVFTLQFQ